MIAGNLQVTCKKEIVSLDETLVDEEESAGQKVDWVLDEHKLFATQEAWRQNRGG